jgi:hypothetical protein
MHDKPLETNRPKRGVLGVPFALRRQLSLAGAPRRRR